MLDEYQLQEKSRRLQDGTDGPWKPTGGTIEETESLLTTSPNYTNPKMFKAPHSLRQWFRVGSWTLIAIAIIAFFVVMWLPSHPMWLIITIASVFAVAVISHDHADASGEAGVERVEGPRRLQTRDVRGRGGQRAVYPEPGQE